MKQILAILAILLLMAAPAIAQEIDCCEGNFDYDQDVDGTDAALFKEDFGRVLLTNLAHHLTPHPP